MALKFIDTATPKGSFPIAYSSDVAVSSTDATRVNTLLQAYSGNGMGLVPTGGTSTQVLRGNGVWGESPASAGNLSLVKTNCQITNTSLNDSYPQWNHMVSGKGMIVVSTGPAAEASPVDDVGGLMYSTDGYTFTYGTEGPAFGQVAYGKNIFVSFPYVASGETISQVRSSADGISWTTSTLSTTIAASTVGNLGVSVCYGRGVFVAIPCEETNASSGRSQILYSGDGATWASVTNSVSALNWSNIVYANNQFWVAGRTSTGVVLLTSTNGSTWTQATTTTLATIYRRPILIYTNECLAVICKAADSDISAITVLTAAYADATWTWTQQVSTLITNKTLTISAATAPVIIDRCAYLLGGAKVLFEIDASKFDTGNSCVITYETLPDTLLGTPNSVVGVDRLYVCAAHLTSATNVVTSSDRGHTAEGWATGFDKYAFQQEGNSDDVTRIIINLTETQSGDLQLDASDVNAIADPMTKTDGQVLTYNGTTAQWEAQDGGGGQAVKYVKTFTTSDWTTGSGSTPYSITVAASTHQLTNVDALVYLLNDGVYLRSSGYPVSVGYNLTIDSNNTVTLATDTTFSGKLVIF